MAGFTKETPSPQRRVSIAFSASGEPPRGNELTVSVTVSGADGLPVPYHGGVPDGWVCDEPPVGAAIQEMSCTRDQTGPSIPPLEFSMRGYTPLVTASISAAGNTDSSPDNDTDQDRAPFWDQMP